MRFYREGQGIAVPLLNFNTHSHNINEIPDLFIYVFVNDECFSYQRLKAKQFFEFDQIFTLKLLPDQFKGESYSVCEAGIMTLSLNLTIPHMKQYFPQYKNINKSVQSFRTGNVNVAASQEIVDPNKLKKKLTSYPKKKLYTIVFKIYQVKFIFYLFYID